VYLYLHTRTAAIYPIIYRHKEREEIIQEMECGVIPFYIKDEGAFKKQRLSMANIRSERILEDKQSYWYKIRNKLCLIPVNGFYEYRGNKGLEE